MQQSYYGEIYSRSYDIGDKRKNLLAFYLDRWEDAGSPTPVLEPMCGTGFFLAAFLHKGADIDGFDSSEHMLKICQEKVDQAGGGANLYVQKLEDLNLPRSYSFIYIPDRSFAHLYEREVTTQGARKLFQQLIPGGTLLLDVRQPPPEGEFGKPGETSVWLDERIEGSVVLCSGLWSERDNGRVIRHCVKQELFTDGKLVGTELFDYNERFYDREEFAELLAAAGFENITVSKGHEEGEIGPHDTIVFSCQKPSES